MRLVLDLYYPDAGKWAENKHPRAKSGQHGGEFVKKGQEGSAKGAAKPAQKSTLAQAKKDYEAATKEFHRIQIAELTAHPNKRETPKLRAASDKMIAASRRFAALQGPEPEEVEGPRRAEPKVISTKNATLLKLTKSAKVVPNWKSPQARAICPTLDPQWWKKQPEAVREDAAYYTAVSEGNRIVSAVQEAVVGKEKGTVAGKAAATVLQLLKRPEAKLQADVFLKRDADLSPKMIDRWKKALAEGKSATFTHKGFMSTSMENDFAFPPESDWDSGEVEYNVRFKITARKGTPALGLAPVSEVAEENEVLLPHGQRFEVCEIKRVNAELEYDDPDEPGANKYEILVVTS